MAALSDWDWNEMVADRDWDRLREAASQAEAAGLSPFRARIEAGRTMLMMAAGARWARGCSLIAPSSLPDAVDADGDTALMIALKCSAPEAALALAPFSDASKLDADGDAPIHVAVREGYVEAAKALAGGVPFDRAGAQGLAPIFLAIRAEDEPLAAVLARKAGPACLSMRDFAGHTPLTCALALDLEPLALGFIAIGSQAQCSAVDPRGLSPYMVAIEEGLDQAAAALADKCEVESRDVDGDDALDVALLHGRWEQAKRMVARAGASRAKRFQDQLARAMSWRGWLGRSLGI